MSKNNNELQDCWDEVKKVLDKYNVSLFSVPKYEQNENGNWVTKTKSILVKRDVKK